ncbi:MAG: phosphate ABC transporter permease PstA [Bifidobacteriaceae bacterium]|jgi:phosphate transport system permease protein|nr:phosphate ABC transporter permease PstA [Bifidobacteriaceae bacterium]
MAVIVLDRAPTLALTTRTVRRGRRAANTAATWAIYGLFAVALVPLVSLVWTALSRGLARFDTDFVTNSMRGVVGAGGGALHAILGTGLITGATVLLSVPVGIATAIYLVEYGRGAFARTVTFLVDVMTGIPSIVAGLFAYTVFSLILGPGARSGLAGALALSLLMIPIVVRTSEEMLRLVPDDLREAAYALGTPKYRTIGKIVLPTAISGIVSGVMIGVARIVGETAPLLLVAGYSDAMNYNVFSERMTTLPVFIYQQWKFKGTDVAAYDNRAWTAALMLIAFVLLLNLASRLVARVFAPKAR